ncbi:MAG TPA: serine hydrolase [Clostridia bacterium]|nr:serine hydrolase [Clostridia bacterium]
MDISAIQKRVDSLFSGWNNDNTPGMAVAIVKDGSVIHMQGYGMANLENGTPITACSVFDSGSLSKMLTGFAIAMLVQDKKVSLDDDIRKFIGELPDLGKVITIRNLLHHTSGLRCWSAFVNWLGDMETIGDVIRIIKRQKALNFNPGDEFLYCNTGYVLLARVIENATGQPFAEWTKDNIFSPLGMTNTYFCTDHNALTMNATNGYTGNGGGGYKKRMMRTPAGSSALFTTVEDLSKWLLNMDNGAVGGESVLRITREKGSLNNGKEVQYGFGLFVGQYKGVNIIEHGGECGGYRSAVSFSPDKRFGIALLSNTDTVDAWQLVRKLYDICLFDESGIEVQGDNINKPKIAAVSSEIYDSYLGDYLIEPGHAVSIIKENHRLYWHITGQPRFELLPVSETEFIDKDGDPVTFHRNQNGICNEVTLVWAWGKNVTATRIASLDLSHMKGIEGKYYSEEADTVYAIAVDEGKLVASNARHEDIVLTACSDTQFAGDPWWFRQVDFIRDENGYVLAFELTNMGQARNLRFNRMAQQKL